MKRLIWKVLFLALLLVSLTGILNFFYAKTNTWKHNIDRYSNMPDNIQLANLGSSHGDYSFNYTDLPYRTFKFSFSAQHYLYDYALLSQYIEKFDKNAVVLILIEYFEVTHIKTDYSSQLAWYYRVLDKNHLPHYSLKDYLRYKAVPILTVDANYVVRELIKFLYPVAAAQQEDSFLMRTEIERINSAKRRYIEWAKPESTSPVWKFRTDAGEEGFAYNKNLVSKMIELCLAHDIQPVLISTPLVSVLNRIFAEESPDFLDTFYRLSRELQETYPTVPYFDYSHDPRFENDFSLFGDQDHLNAAGAKKFTAIVVSDLQANGLLAGGE